MKKKLILMALAAILVCNTMFTAVLAADKDTFTLISTEKSDALGGTVYRYRHDKTGAEVIYNDNNSETREFVLGFKTPPTDSKGANHVLEHALFCGSEKYPTKNIMHYIQNGSSSLRLNGITADDCTYYLIQTQNTTEYYNMIDVYLNGIFHPLFLTDENIFRQQGIRIEYADGAARYNGVVYNELRIKNLNTAENSVNFLADKLYRGIYGDTTPVFSAGGELADIKNLTYEDLLRVYNTFYIPSNSMTYLSGKQDIHKTLDALDVFFSENTAKAPDISFDDTKQIPQNKLQEYNINETTKTVDIGFMSSGVPAAADPKERFANEIVFDIIKQKMEEKTGLTNTYISGGNTGGISTLALMISEVPLQQKDDIIKAYNEVLKDLDENGIDSADIDAFVDNDDRYFYQNYDNVFIGLLYQDNPLAYTEIHSMREYYKNHKEYFHELLQKYFTENPCSVTVVSGNGTFDAEDSVVKVSAEELQRIKSETEAFQKWNDTEDDPSVIGKIPFLTLDEVKDAPQKSDSVYAEQDGIPFYFTEKSDESSASLYFPLDIEMKDLDYVHLMYAFWQYQADKSGSSFFASILPLENAQNSEEINPHLQLWLSGENKSDSLQKALSFLESEEMWNADALKEYISKTPKEIIDSYYDPYFVSSELKGSALSAGGRFGIFVPANTIVKDSPQYCRFLQSLDLNDAEQILGKMKAQAEKIIRNNKPVIGYVGNSADYSEFKNTVCELFQDAENHKSAALNLPAGYYSAATITKLADANHFMLAAAYGEEKYSGKMAVLGKVLTTKYIYPIMRGKHGAYGASISFREDGMVCAVTGLADIDFAIGLWQGIGDYLRSMNMTQNELNSYIVSAVQEYDEWEYTSSEYGATFALEKRTPEECEQRRNEMLQTTVQDIKEYADFVDSLVNQKRVFAVLGKSAADSAKFDFAYYGNADTLEVTPRLTKYPTDYMQGRSDGSLALEDNITRAEAAQMISRIIADTRKASGGTAFSDVTSDAWYCGAVASLCEKGIMTGYEDGSFRPNQNITRAELAAILSKFIYNGDTSLQAADVDSGAWYADALAKMINAGYIHGYEDGSVRPDQFVTRGETKIMIDRMLNK